MGSSSAGSYLPGRVAWPSLTDPRPRMAMRVLVSACMRFCVLPRGPMMRPKKLYPGCSATGMMILRCFLAGRWSGGGQNAGHISTMDSTSSARRAA